MNYLGIPFIYYVTSLDDNLTYGTLRTGITIINNMESNYVNYYFIVFNVSGTINIMYDLPDILKSINFVGSQNEESIIINLNNTSGLNIKSNNCSINGLSITNSKNSGINVYRNYTLIEKCYIYDNKENGIYLEPGSSYNKIGTNTTLNSNYVSNILVNNGKNGIEINNSNNNILHKNYIGTIDGTTPSPNGENGIYITNGSMNNIIGGKAFKNSDGQTNNPTGSEDTTTAVYIIPPEGNLISGNIKNGILVNSNSTKNMFHGNFIGTTSTGLSPMGNGLDGILFIDAPYNGVIGCEKYNNPFVYYNVISGNDGNGIQITNSDECIIQGNFAGIGMNNNTLCSNQLNGILVNGSSATVVIGGPIPLGNNLSGNKMNGTHITDDVTYCTNYNSFCGVYSFGTIAPNGENGIIVDGNAKYTTIKTCVLSGNNENGLILTGFSSYATVEDVICGTSSNLATAIPNKNGMTLSGNSNNNTITHEESFSIENVFSGNTNNGLQLLDDTNNNIFYNCKIGTSAYLNGEVFNVPNGNNGIFLDNNTNNNIFTSIVDNKLLTLYNTIAGNKTYGIFFNSVNAKNNSFTNNYIGVNIYNDIIPNISGNFGGTIDSSNTITPNNTN